jgi:choline dehydrogenase-like flavoprotein
MRAALSPDKGAFVDASQSGFPVDEADFVIAGSGAGGSAAARILAAAGHSVVVLEEGPRVTRREVGSIAGESMARLFRKAGKQAAFGRAATPILQGMCVGGTTFVNSAIVWRLPEKVLARWHEEHGLELLRKDELDAAAAIIERELSETAVVEGVNSNQQDLLLRAGSQKSGIEGRFIHRYEKGCRGSGRCLHGCPHDAKQSTAITSLDHAVRDGAFVVSRARVERVLLDHTRAVGVRGTIAGDARESGQAFAVRARRGVIVAGGVIQSSNLLWRSGIRGKHLGEHFMAHPGTAVMGFYPARVDSWRGASQGWEAYGLRDTLGVKFESINVPPEVSAARLPGAGARLAKWIDRLPHVANWSVALRAEAQGRIRPSLLFGDKVNYDLGERDLHRLREAMQKLAEMHFNAGAEEVLTGIAGLPESIRSPDELGVFATAPLDARAYNVVCTHLFGGCRAGKDPATSVVDPSLRVHNAQALYVMDASIFPSNTGVNPQHSIMSIAAVSAARLA